eukprot:649435-Hanusia_phi.AAC.1
MPWQVVDAAVGLQNKGHRVVMYTSHHDKNHCFQETRDGTLNVEVIVLKFVFVLSPPSGLRTMKDALPPPEFNSSQVILLTQIRYDVIIVDQLSVGTMTFGSVIVLRFCCLYADSSSHPPCNGIENRLLLSFSGSQIVWPVKVLMIAMVGEKEADLRRSRSWLKSLYRLPFDWLEEFTTLLSHRILVNSKYTSQVFHETFSSAKISPEVLYPSINLKSYEQSGSGTSKSSNEAEKLFETLRKFTCFISINRFERKKNIELAVKAFGTLRGLCQEAESLPLAFLKRDFPKEEFQSLRLIIAGGYDPRVVENVRYVCHIIGTRHLVDLG